MPTYEYACKECGEHLEVVQSFKDDALTECPACGGSLRKVFSAAGIIFKGSGWHVKDYASSSNRPSGKDEGSSDGDGGGSDAKADATDTGSKETADGGKDGAKKTSEARSGSDSGSKASETSTSSAEKKSA